MSDSTALDLFSPSALPAVDGAMDRLHRRITDLAEAGDTLGIANWIEGLDHLTKRIEFVRTEAGRLAYELLSDETYTWAGEEKTRKVAEMVDDVTRVEPWLSGGGWRGIDYPRAMRLVVDRAFGLESRIVDGEGEIRGTMGQLVQTILDCFSFSGLKSNADKGTGLVAHGFERGDFADHYQQPRHDVKVQGS